MNKIKRVWKTLLVFFAVAMIPLALMGCAERDKQPSGEQAETEHPSKEKPSDEHPSKEHPK